MAPWPARPSRCRRGKPQRSRRRRDGGGGICAAAVIFAAPSLAANLTSEGFLEADGVAHYLFARFALQEPHYLVNVWGCLLFTILYALPSCYGGLAGGAGREPVLALLCAWLTCAWPGAKDIAIRSWRGFFCWPNSCCIP